ncbi:DMT family transporter [Paenibacillus chartarius]|uniref:DMT family transporter n=1 Tax=Paenibacillus chartarius TaxID=747481 RepID=A0ABV6DM73_9BACL
MNSFRWFYILAVIIGASSYGILSSCIKLVYEAGFNDGQVTLSQVTVGTLMLWVVVLCVRSAWTNPFRGPWIKLSLVGIFGLLMTTVFYNIALSELNASLAIVLLFQFTWITMAMDSVVSRRAPTRRQIGAIAVILAGTILAVDLFTSDWSRVSIKGIMFGLLSAMTYSTFLFFAGRVKTDMDPFMKSALMQTATLPVLFILYPPLTYIHSEHWVPLLSWGLLIGLFGQVLPTIMFNVGIPRIGSSLSAMIGSVELPVAIIAAYVILGEPVGVMQWLGMLLILLGIVAAELKPNVKEARMD